MSEGVSWNPRSCGEPPHWDGVCGEQSHPAPPLPLQHPLQKGPKELPPQQESTMGFTCPESGSGSVM